MSERKYSGLKKSLEDRKYQNQTEPRFTYLSFQSAQQPMQAPFEYQELYTHIGDKKRRNYAACVTAMDDAIGQVVNLYKGKYRKFLLFESGSIDTYDMLYKLNILLIKGSGFS